MSVITEGQDFSSVEAINRMAFPACRVFIYGKDVSQDIMSVRVNQSGGSSERSPSTVTFTLSNFMSKYTYTRKDIMTISEIKGKISNTWENGKASDMFVSGLFSSTGPKLDSCLKFGGDAAPYPLGGNTPNMDSVTVQEMSYKLAQATDEEMVYIWRSFSGESSITLEDAKALTEKLNTMRKGMVEDVIRSATFSSYREEDLHYNIKQQVVHDKLSYTAPLTPSGRFNAKLNYPKGVLWDYPMQEGDCIFNLNDPVRIAFRDPFDPRVWFWVFTGFIDIWTEDSGVNGESELTITCTDVSKMVRYSIFQFKTGALDPATSSAFSYLKDSRWEMASDSGFMLQNEIYEGMTIQEILELTFFGAVSAKNVVSNVTDYRALAPILTENELKDLFLHTLQYSPEETDNAVKSFTGTRTEDGVLEFNTTDSKFQNSDPGRQLIKAIVGARKNKNAERFKSLDWKGICTARGVPFKRSSDKVGLRFVAFGETDKYDEQFDCISVGKNLYLWNEMIHHRVRSSDLVNMRQGEYAGTPPSNDTIENIIYKIGTDLKNYPVGHGYVYAFLPGKMETVFGDKAIDQGMGGVGSLHSVFKDRLSILYDFAETLDFRFYATPKGDVVFEVPFYDFEPFDFLPKDTKTKGVVTEGSQFNNLWNDLFKSAYAGKYSSDELVDLTSFSFVLETPGGLEDLSNLSAYMNSPKFDYGLHFSVDNHEQFGFSNTCNDRGLITAYRCLCNYIQSYSQGQNDEFRSYRSAVDYALMPTLGFRIEEGNMFNFISGSYAAELYSALQLNKINANARNVGLTTIPKFGLMVNRPLFWRTRTYYGCIISLSHSYTWNGDVFTSINLNQIKAWSGEIDKDTKRPIMKYLGNSDRPFNLYVFMQQALGKKTGKSGAE